MSVVKSIYDEKMPTKPTFCLFNSYGSNNRKKHQRRATRMIKYLNNCMKCDNLWRGRFYYRIETTHFVRFEDKSGAMLYCLIGLYDKKTKRYTIAGWYDDHEIRICKPAWDMNDWIVEGLDVWKTEDVYNENGKTDYSKIHTTEFKFMPWGKWAYANEKDKSGAEKCF